jgi:hypothetical protein
MYRGYPAPPGYYPPAETYATYTPMKRRSPTMIAWGSALVSVATTAIIAGSSLYAGGAQTTVVCSFTCSSSSADSGAQTTGGVVLALGLVAMGAGIPLIVVGAQKVPESRDAATVAPRLSVGAGKASLALDF